MRAFRFAEQNNYNPQKCKRLGINGAAAREAGQTYEQFLRIAKEEKLDLARNEVTDEAIQRSILAGFTDQVAMRVDAGTLRCNLVHGRRGVLARESVVHHSPLLVASDVREIQGKDGELTVLLNTATAIEEAWLRELLPEAFRTEEKVVFDPVQRRVIARRQMLFRDLLLKAEVTEKAPREEAARVLADAVTSGTCLLVNWDHAVEQWITRLNRLREWMPELDLPAIGEAERRMLVEQICHGAMTYKEIKERAVWPVVKSWLSPAQQDMLEKFAPERIALPNGKKWKIIYDAKAAPVIAARIQELYGVEGSLTIAAGRVPLVIQVLAPESAPRAGDAKPIHLLEGSLPEAEAGASAEVSEARVAVRGDSAIVADLCHRSIAPLAAPGPLLRRRRCRGCRGWRCRGRRWRGGQFRHVD